MASATELSGQEVRAYLLDRMLDSGLAPREALGEAKALWRFVEGVDLGAEGAQQQPEVNPYGPAPVVGVALTAHGGWQRIDEQGAPVRDRALLDTHPLFSRIRETGIDGEAVVQIPRFWVRHVDCGGERRWLLSAEARVGYSLHPAFAGGRRALHIGKYQAGRRPGEGAPRAASRPGLLPWTDISFDEAQLVCKAMGAGWRMWTIQELAAIQLLMLVDLGGADMQGLVGMGNVQGGPLAPAGTTAANWRGLCELWGNVWQMVDGLRLSVGGEILLRPTGGDWIRTGVLYGPDDDDGYPSSFHQERGPDFDLSLLFLPAEVEEDPEDALVPDYVWGRWAGRESIALCGGYRHNAGYAGVFALSLLYERSHSRSAIGFRPAFAS